MVTTWDSANKSSLIALSDGDKTAINDGGAGLNHWARATTGKTAGKWYFEVQIGTSIGCGVGICNEDKSNFEGGWPDLWVCILNSNDMADGNIGITGILNGTASCVLGVAVDIDNHKIWFAANNAWAGDPEAGTGYFESTWPHDGTTMYPVCAPNYTTESHTIECNPYSIVYSPPSGFLAWDDPGHIWNSADKDAKITLTDSDLTADCSDDTLPPAVRSSHYKESNFWYYEVEIDGSSPVIGIATDAFSVSTSMTASSYAWCLDTGSGRPYAVGSIQPHNLGSFGVGDVVGVALNISTGKLWFSKNGTYIGNPSTGTDPDCSGITGTKFYGCINPFAAKGTVTFENGSYVYTKPTGSYGWSEDSTDIILNATAFASVGSLTVPTFELALPATLSAQGALLSNLEFQFSIDTAFASANTFACSEVFMGKIVGSTPFISTNTFGGNIKYWITVKGGILSAVSSFIATPIISLTVSSFNSTANISIASAKLAKAFYCTPFQSAGSITLSNASISKIMYLATSLPPLSASLVSGGLITSILPAFTSTLNATIGRVSTISIVLPAFTSALNADAEMLAEIICKLNNFTSSVNCLQGNILSAQINLPVFTSVANIFHTPVGSIEVSLPALAADILAKNGGRFTDYVLRHSRW